MYASKLIRRRMATEIASKVEVEAEKYTFAEIFECILHGQYPVEADKTLCPVFQCFTFTALEY